MSGQTFMVSEKAGPNTNHFLFWKKNREARSKKGNS